jgi:HEAT repeat protein
VPVLGGGGRDGAPGLLATLASCDAEDGEAEIAAWLAARTAPRAADELIKAAAGGSPGLRGAAFAVLDRIGPDAVPAVQSALADPVVRAHAAVWLHEHGEQAELGPEDRTWLLVDLGAGLLEEADPRDVVAELLPELPPDAQAEIVAGLWRVQHPAVTDLLTALSDHHPDPSVARAARKAAFKARSPSAGPGARPS